MYLMALRHWPMLAMLISVVLTITGCGDGHSGHSH